MPNNSKDHSLDELAALGALSKRRNDIVVFAGRNQGQLMDNVKYLFLHAAHRDFGFKPWFFTTQRREYRMLKEQGLPVVTFDSHGVNILTSAGLLVLDDQPVHVMEAWCLCSGAKKMQLWHGVPLKKIGFPEIESGINMDAGKAAGLRFGYSGFDVVASTSSFATERLFKHVFDAKSYMEHGYPRNDVFFRNPDKNDFLNVDRDCYATIKRHRKAGGKVVVYMPTFRDTGRDFIDGKGVVVLDPNGLAGYADRTSTIFVLKLHPYVEDARLSAIPGVIRYPSHMDIYPLLSLTDALITDYSSVYFDYLLLDRPIFFFAYDLERYLRNDRDFFFDFTHVTPGHVVRTQPELLQALHNNLQKNQDEFIEQRANLRREIHTHCDAGASERICRHIASMLGSKQHE